MVYIEDNNRLPSQSKYNYKRGIEYCFLLKKIQETS